MDKHDPLDSLVALISPNLPETLCDAMRWAVTEIRQQRNIVAILKDTMTDQQSEIENLIEAVSFYGNIRNYETKGWEGDPNSSLITRDWGKRARTTLQFLNTEPAHGQK